MPHLLERCDDEEAQELLSVAMSQYHSSLADEEVQVGLLAAKRAKKKGGGWVDGPVLALRGFACCATVQVTNLKERALGMPDAIITLNWEWWGRALKSSRLAVMDHELEHLELAVDHEGEPKQDSLNRPLLMLRKHDWEFGGFLSIVERHGINAVEALAVKGVATSPVFIQRKLFKPEDFEPLEQPEDDEPTDDIVKPRFKAGRIINIGAMSRDGIEEVLRNILVESTDALANQQKRRKKGD